MFIATCECLLQACCDAMPRFVRFEVQCPLCGDRFFVAHITEHDFSGPCYYIKTDELPECLDCDVAMSLPSGNANGHIYTHPARFVRLHTRDSVQDIGICDVAVMRSGKRSARVRPLPSQAHHQVSEGVPREVAARRPFTSVGTGGHKRARCHSGSPSAFDGRNVH